MARGTTGTTLRPNELWGAARHIAQKILPYLGKGIYGLRDRPIVGFAPDGAYPIAVTERGVVLWDPQWWSTKPAVMLGCGILHECGHWLQRHAKRRGDRDPKQFNTAGDCELNDDLLPAIENYFSRKTSDSEAVMRFVRTWIYPSSFELPNGKIAEFYYNQIPPPQTVKFDCCCGSGAGHPHPKEDDPAAQAADEEMGHSEIGAEVIRHQVALDIKDFASRNPRIGTERGGWFRWADEELRPPKLRWQDQAARLARGVVTTVLGNIDTSYAYPSRRQACVGIGPRSPILPALVSPMPEVHIAIDTSGSMGQSQFVDAGSEILSILQTLHTARFTFHTVDTDVHVTVPIRNIRDILRTRLPGGGGTNFYSLFEMLTRYKPMPNLLFLFTDGHAFVPPTPPPFPVVNILVGAGAAPLPWGTNLFVPYEVRT
jgi:predicted metal-dependent peptidase